MTGTVRTTVVIKGKKIRLEQTYDDDDLESFQTALKKVNEQAKAMLKAERAKAASKHGSYRKPKGSN